MRSRIASAPQKREWKEYTETHSKELFEKLLTDGPRAWPLREEENLVFQNGLHALQVRKNRAALDGDEAETKAIDAQLKRAEPLLRRLQAELNQGEQAGLPIPAVQAARTAAATQSNNHIKQLGLAVHNYNSVYNHLPQQAIFGKDGKPLLSWRVALLPYLDQAVLYKKFKLDEPWDSPHNHALLKYMPSFIFPRGKPHWGTVRDVLPSLCRNALDDRTAVRARPRIQSACLRRMP